MDPVSVAGLALSVASLSLQVYTGCIQGIQLLVTALGYEDDCRFLNLRLRMEQQRLFAWSETSGLLDLDADDSDKVVDHGMFRLHRKTILDLLIQIRCLFDDFTAHQIRHKNLLFSESPYGGPDDGLIAPEKDARRAKFPMSEKRRAFLKKAMSSLRTSTQSGWMRLRWISFDKAALETLLARFSILNDDLTSLLDHSLQVEMRHTVQETNRRMLLLHHKMADLSHLVLALKSQLDASARLAAPPGGASERQASMDALNELADLAEFKAFNQAVDSASGTLGIADAAASFPGLLQPDQTNDIQLPRHLIELDPEPDAIQHSRCEGVLRLESGAEKRVWIEWKDYDDAGLLPGSLSKREIVDRVRKLAMLLNHIPKPDAFRTPHCLGFFDKASPVENEDEVELSDRRLGLVFERPSHDQLDSNVPPVSLLELILDKAVRKPRVTERVKLAHAIGSCLLYLHAVNWLHKGLRSHNVLFFRALGGHVDYRQPYLSGFDFSRPGGPEEMTDVPGGAEADDDDLYRHPRAQRAGCGARERSKKSFDIYSLGVVLVELAHWKTIGHVLRLDLGFAGARPDLAPQVRDSLLSDESLASVGAEMGERFETATRTCLAGGVELSLRPGDDETADEVAERLSKAYYEKVVKTLAEVIV